MKNFGGVIVVAAILLGFFFRDITGYSIPEFVGRMFQQEVTPQVLEGMAEEQNQSLPIVGRDGVAWIDSRANGMTLQQTYQVRRFLAPHEVSSARSQAARNIPSSACADDATARLLDDGVQIEYVYLNQDRRKLFSVSVDSSMC